MLVALDAIINVLQPSCQSVQTDRRRRGRIDYDDAWPPRCCSSFQLLRLQQYSMADVEAAASTSAPAQAEAASSSLAAPPQASTSASPAPPVDGDDPSATSTVYIKNLDEKVKLDILKTSLNSLFSVYGHVLGITAHGNLRMRGQAFVAFDDVEVAKKAVKEVNGFPLYGKAMVRTQKSEEQLHRRLQLTRRSSSPAATLLRPHPLRRRRPTQDIQQL